MECLTAANGFVRIRYRSALPWNTPFHSISIPLSYRAQLHHPLLPRESFIAIHIRCVILLVQGADKNLKTRGIIFIACRTFEVIRQGMNRFPLYELVLWVKEPSRVPGEWCSRSSQSIALFIIWKWV